LFATACSHCRCSPIHCSACRFFLRAYTTVGAYSYSQCTEG
jgi:hypothetical protein